jgi:PEP-CTERM motif
MHRTTSSRLSILTAAVAALGIGSFVRADVTISNFTPGDLVVLRGGDATNPDTTASANQVAVYLDEYTTAGNYVGTMDVPSTGPNALTIPGIGDFEHQGVLSNSTDGNYLSFAGYNVPVGSPNANTAGGADQPVIGVVGNSASTLSTSTVVNSYGPGSANPFIRGAITNGGADENSLNYWTFGKFAASGATSNGGLAYVSGGTTTTVEGFADWRDIINANGQMYGGTGSSSVGNHGPYQVSTGEPTTNLGNSLATNTQLGNYPGGQSASALSLLDLPGDPNTQNGLNVLYTIGDQSTPGITKYYYNGTTWVNQTNVGLNINDVVNPTGLIATTDPSNPNWVDLTVSGSNGIYTYVDETGYNGAIPDNAFTDLVDAPTNEAFYGIATAVPEPASVGLIALGAMGLLARRRARKV